MRNICNGYNWQMLETDLGLKVNKQHSGPLGGDQQIGALIAEGKIDVLIFFWDPLEPLPHDPDIKALLRLAVVWNIPVACNRSTADFLFASPLFFGSYQRKIPNFSTYQNRKRDNCDTALCDNWAQLCKFAHPKQWGQFEINVS